jgi:hypothetical protein
MNIHVRTILPVGEKTPRNYNLERLIVLTRRAARIEYLRNGRTDAFVHHMEWLVWALDTRRYG